VGLTRALGAAGTLERRRVGDGVLVGSRCTDCSARSWPARAVCARCGGDNMATEELPSTGDLLSYTAVWVARGPFAPPYVLGQVDFGDGATVFGHVRGLADGVAVPLTVGVVVAPPGDALDFWFEPVVP